MARIDFDTICKTATAPGRNWTIRDTLRFHYFNPNGLVARKRANDDRIAALAESGAVPYGWNLSRGTMASFEADRLAELAMQSRTTRIKASVAIKLLREHCEQQEAKIAEVA